MLTDGTWWPKIGPSINRRTLFLFARPNLHFDGRVRFPGFLIYKGDKKALGAPPENVCQSQRIKMRRTKCCCRHERQECRHHRTKSVAVGVLSPLHCWRGGINPPGGMWMIKFRERVTICYYTSRRNNCRTKSRECTTQAKKPCTHLIITADELLYDATSRRNNCRTKICPIVVKVANERTRTQHCSPSSL